MNKNILKREVQQYIDDNLKSDIHSILLGKEKFQIVTNKELVDQIEAKKKTAEKLPTWFATPNIYYANKLNISQTSSEIAAKYKGALIDGNSLIDLTGGFGVDTFYFSKKFQKVFHIEKNLELSKIAKHNFEQLEAFNITTNSEDGLGFLKSLKESFDWIYIDPSRRDINNKKVFFLSDCEPDVTEHLDLLLSKSNNLLIKTGPLLDLTIGMGQLKFVSDIHIVSIENDVKEILWLIRKDFPGEPLIKTINIKKEVKEQFEFNQSEVKDCQVDFSEPLSYLYEPNSSIMKSGAFNLVGKMFNLKKLHEHSHIYTSDQLIAFPGRRFKIEKHLPYNRKSLKQLEIKKANITTRNFPETVDQIRKKTKLKDGGSDYLFFSKDLHENCIILQCSKIFF